MCDCVVVPKPIPCPVRGLPLTRQLIGSASAMDKVTLKEFCITLLKKLIFLFFFNFCSQYLLPIYKSKNFEGFYTQAEKGWKESLSKWSPLEKLESMSSRILLPPTCSTTISTCSTTMSTCCNTPNTSSLCTCAANTSSVGNCFPSSRSSTNPRTDQNAGRKDEKKKKKDEEEEEKRGRQIVFSLSINT